MTRFEVDITLEVEAETGQLAIQTARAAGKSLQSRAGIAHASLTVEARPLFDDSAFCQLDGQTSMDTDR